MTNEVIDRYQILEKIGAGGMGTVYLAWDREIEREVALKWLPAYFSQDEHFTERFKREARVVARLEHPHIVPIYDVGENEGRPFIIMRLLKGGTLREQIGKENFDLAALVKGLDEIGDALKAAHARQIIHRDIKPGNILFDEHRSAFLSDFGIAKVLDSATQLTGSGFIGTPAYMSPEQFIGQSIDGRSDQYSLAVVVYEALTGNLPFQGNTAQMMYKHINVVPPEINIDAHPIPKSFNPVLQKALAKDPNDRYARIMDFTAALRIALRQEPIAAALPLAAGMGLLPTPEKPITAPTALDTPSEEETNLLRQNYRQGLEALSRSQWVVALAAFDQVLEKDPNYGNALEFKQQAEGQLSQPKAAPPLSEKPTEVDPDSFDAEDSIPDAADQDEEDSGLRAAAAIGLAAAGGAALAKDLDETSLELPEIKIPPLEEGDDNASDEDLEATSLDLPTGAFAAVSTAADEAEKDLDKTSLDLPAGVFAGDGAPAPVESDLEKTSLDLPAGAFAAAGIGAAAADLGATSLDLPPEIAIQPPPSPVVSPPPAAAVPPVAGPPQEKKRGIPLWAIIGGIVFLLLLCGGGAYASVNIFGPGDRGTTAEPPGGGVIAASAGQGNSEELGDVVETEVVETAEPEQPTPEPPTPTDEPTEEPVVIVEDTAAPPTATDEPTAIPEPQAPIVRVNVASANVRRGPGVVYAVLVAVFENAQAEVVAQTRDGSWFLVELEDGSLGWISRVVVELLDAAAVEQVEIAATIPAAPTSTPVPPTATPIPLPTIVPPVDNGGGGGNGGGNGGGGGGDGGGDPPPPPQYTAEPP